MPRQHPTRLSETPGYDAIRRKAETNKRKAQFAEPTRVKLVRWHPSDLFDENKEIPPGTLGWTTLVDDHGTVHVDWENGKRLGVTTEDEIEEVAQPSN